MRVPRAEPDWLGCVICSLTDLPVGNIKAAYDLNHNCVAMTTEPNDWLCFFPPPAGGWRFRVKANVERKKT